jgi:hypothetical protein
MRDNGMQDIAARLEHVEAEVRELRAQLVRLQQPKLPWWEETAGMFKDSPAFEEIVRLGQAYRQADRDKAARKKPSGGRARGRRKKSPNGRKE